jgi:hypothetical protein
MAACGSQAVRLLLDRGATRGQTKRNETRWATPHLREREGRGPAARSAEVNVRNIRGYSPLMLAASSDTIPSGAVKRLLAKGADTSCKGDYDETARDLAAKRGHTEVTRLLGGMPQKQSEPARCCYAGHRRHVRQYTIPDAVERALAMAEKQGYNFIRIGGCNSCHSQDLPSAAAAFARGRGLQAPREIPQLPRLMPSASASWILRSSGHRQGVEPLRLRLNGVRALHDAVVRMIKALQSAQGHWPASESRRPPMSTGEFQAAALAIYSLQHYAPAGDEAACEQVVARAAAWLQRAKPETTQDRAFHALGLAWGNAGSTRQPAVVRSRRYTTDGAGANCRSESDAYATGQALYALHTAGGMSIKDPVYQKGVDYLLRTQATDGTWRVRSRSIWLQPYFESGFPYGPDQFISTAGTAWASMALAAATQPPTTTQSSRTAR